MSLSDLQSEGRLPKHRPSPQETANLLERAERDLQDAQVPATSLDGRFVAAYHSALSLRPAHLARPGGESGGKTG